MRTHRGLVGGAVALAIALVSTACATSGRDKLASPAKGDKLVPLSISKPLSLRPEGGLNPTAATDAASGAVYLAWAQEAPAPHGQGSEHEAQGSEHKEDPVLQVLVARSDDGGRSFAEPVVANPPTDHVVSYTVSPTEVEIGPKGEIYVLYLHSDPDFKVPGWDYGRSYLHVVRSDDGGKTFAPPVEIGAGEPDTSMEMANLFVAPGGDVYASWLDFREELSFLGKKARGEIPEDEQSPETTQLRVARSTDGAASFGPSALVTQGVCGCCGTKVAQGENGPLFATTRSSWGEFKESVDTVRDVFVSASRDAGSTWSKPAKISDDGFKISGCPDIQPGLSVDSKDRLHAAWYTGTGKGPGVYYAVSGDDGKTFSDPVALLTGEWVPYADVKLALDGKDNVWVAFEDRRGEEDLIQVVRIAAGGGRATTKAWPGTAPDVTAVGESALVTWGAPPPKAEGEESHHESGGIQALLISPGETN